MAVRKLLLPTFHFPPSAASGTFRALGFVRHLPRFGWRTVVVAPREIPWEPTDNELLDQVPSSADVYSIPYPTHRLWKPLRKHFPYGAWLPFAAAGCCRAIRDHRPDAILTSGPPHAIHLLGLYVHRLTGRPWVADFRDPWVTGDPSQRQRHVAGWERRAERSVLREADAVVINTPGAADFLRQTYAEYAEKMTPITNGYDPECFAANPVPPLCSPTFDIVHTGEIYANRSPGPLLDAVQGLDTALLGGRVLRVRFIGEFRLEEQRKETEDRIGRGLEGSVFLEGHVSYKQSSLAMVQSDLLVLLDTPGRRAGVPAKLYEYIGAGRPILALAEPESDVAWVLRESGVAHRIAPPLDVEAIRLALVELLRESATVHRGEQNETIKARFTRERLAGELATLLDACLRPPPVPVGDGYLHEVAS